jgi:hypothetical protein
MFVVSYLDATKKICSVYAAKIVVAPTKPLPKFFLLITSVSILLVLGLGVNGS